MKKAIYLLLLTIFATSAIFAIDIEGSASVYTAGKTASIKTIDILEIGNANIGITLPLDFNKNTKLKIAGDVSATWKINTTKVDFVADCTELELLMSIPLSENSYGSFEMGRFSVKDCTELIFDQKLDGVRFLIDSPFIKTHLYGGYTGFINARKNEMLPSNTATGVYAFAPSFITFDFFAYLPDIYEDKSLGLEFLGALNSTAAASNKMYAIARIDGEFLYFIPYTLCSAFSWTNEGGSFGNMANLSFASMEYTINSMHFGGKVLHASGNTPNFKNFRQLTAVYADKASSILYSNLINIGLFFDNTTSDKVKISTDAYAFLSLGEQQAIIFDGLQWALNINIPFTGSSKLVFDVNQFIPIKNKSLFHTTLSMNLTFGF
ncbi:MAG: hypothetical protein K5751_05550 [Treponemataceae bacterium]|nr:hypothetical protein [Treponemataceae bacterium]